MPKSSNDNEPLNKVDVNAVLRDLMDVAKVALGPGKPEVRREDGLELLADLLIVIDRVMPDELQQQDKRVVEARAVLALARL